MSTTAQAFSTFLAEIGPTEYQSGTLIPARESSVVDNLKSAFPSSSDMPFWQVHLIGSAAKGTIIKPIEDVDVLAVFSDENGVYAGKYRNDSQAFLYRVKKAYDGSVTQQVGARGQAVRVFFQSGGYVDVAPVFWSGGDDYLLPSGDGTWITTSPMKANAWFDSKNRDLSYHLKPLVRLLKKWNREHSSRFKSYHLETVTASIFSSLGGNHRDALAKFYKWAPNHLCVSDPGGHSADLSAYLTYAQRQDLLSSLNSNADRAGKALTAEDEGDHDEAKRLWSYILGGDFPTA